MILRFKFPIYYKSIISIIVSLQLCVYSAGQKVSGNYSTVSTLPLIVINTTGNEIVPETKVTARCKIIDNGPGLSNDTADAGNIFSGYIGIEIRGQSSQMFPKKSYSVELRSSAGEDISVPILGMPEEEDWILHAPYSDKTLLRNALAYYLGRKMGRWQPGFRFCVVYIDGDYRGIYMLIEKIKRDRSRVDIARLDINENTGDDLTGGYIIKVDKYGDLSPNEYFVSYPSLIYPGSRNYVFTYVYPKAEDITLQQKEYIGQFVTNFEDCLNSSGFNDEVKGYSKYIDRNSFIDFQIIQELTNNVDGYVFSTFFFKDKDSNGGKMHAGPLWDFDLGFGNVNYSPVNLSTTGWLYTHFDDKWCMHWWARLMEDMEYAKSFSSRWKELRKTSFHNDSIEAYIMETYELLHPEIDRNFNRWQILGNYVWPNYYIGKTYNEDLTFFKSWISGRMKWIDNYSDGAWINLFDTFEDNLLVYPNPATDIINYATYMSSTSLLVAELYDITGRLVKSKSEKPLAAGYSQYSIDISGISPGKYILILKTGERVISRRAIIVVGN